MAANSVPGNANLPIGGLCNANREIGVPGIQLVQFALIIRSYHF